jgi:hypothetical protein
MPQCAPTHHNKKIINPRDSEIKSEYSVDMTPIMVWYVGLLQGRK